MSSLLNPLPVKPLSNDQPQPKEPQGKVRETWNTCSYYSPYHSSPVHQEHQINVFELTLLLKVMGFRLNHLDYEEPVSGTPSASSNITIEIRCEKQNIVSRLSASGEYCSCPAKKEETENEASFWEILGTAPSSSPGGKKRIEDTSSNLLPELSQRGVSNTKQLLSLIYEGFHKDHLPSTTTNSPEPRAEVPPNPIHTSTQIKSPRRLIPVLNKDMLLQEDPFLEKASPAVLTAPPNTPKVGVAGGFGKFNSVPNVRHRDHLVYLEVMAAKERLEKALLAMKTNIADELSSLHGPALDLSSQKIFEEVEPVPGVSPATFKRRSSMGSFPSGCTEIVIATVI